MTNENCLEGIACPECLQTDAFDIEAVTTATVHDDGVEVNRGYEWDSDSSILCRSCNRTGTVSEFRGEQRSVSVHEERMAVLCTGHVPFDESQLITWLLDQGDLTGMQRDVGWLIHTGRPHADAKQLAYLQGLMKGKGFDWILFDCDQEHTDGLPSFDW